MTINSAIEALYNNQMLVPNGAEIMEGVMKASADYCTRGPVELDLAYGDGERHKLDLFHPDDGAMSNTLVVFIHGGYWQWRDRKDFSTMASGLNGQGLSVALPSYDLCPAVSVMDIVEQMRACCAYLWKRFNKPLILAGHSAGGHLTAAMLATDWAQVGVEDIKIVGAAPISGVFDLGPLVETSLNEALQFTPDTAREASPLFWQPRINVPTLAYVGGGESEGFLWQTKTLVDTWNATGFDARYIEIPEANHFTAVAPLRDKDSEMVKAITELAV